MKNKKEKNTTVVPEKNGAENVVTKEKFDFKSKVKNILVVIKNAFVKFGSLVKKGFVKLAGLVKTHRNISIGVACAVVILVGVLFIFPSLSKPSDEETIKNRVNDLGVTFYEDFYYVSTGNGDADKRTETLSKYTSMGIKVSLENLIRYYVTTDKFKNEFTTISVKQEGSDERVEKNVADTSIPERVESLENAWFKYGKEGKEKLCDVDNTKIVLYPVEPYGEKDYKIEVVTACGFKDEETSESTTKKQENKTTQKVETTTTKKTKKK